MNYIENYDVLTTLTAGVVRGFKSIPNYQATDIWDFHHLTER